MPAVVIGRSEYEAIQKAASDLAGKMTAICSSVEDLTRHVSRAVVTDVAQSKSGDNALKAVDAELSAVENKALALAMSFSKAIEELCLVLSQRVAKAPNVSPKVLAEPVSPSTREAISAKEVSKATSKAAAPAKASRDLTVPPPDAAIDAHPVHPGWKSVSAPNNALARAMAGRVADWGRIRRMAEDIRSPGYQLRSFFDDCMAAFPELVLFFEGPSSIRHNAALSSGRSGEAEYQRTMGALFVVYWMLRLDIDGRSGFCYGVDENWLPVHVLPQEKIDKSFFKMNPDEKRASFMYTMDWNSLEELVDRAGCAGNHGNVERVMALLCLTAFHDIMKIPAMQPIVQPEHAPYHGFEAGVRINDHDLALIYVMDCFPHLLPSYNGLPPDAKRGVLLTQRDMRFNHGWFVQAEAPPGGMLSEFKKLLQAGANQQDIDLYFLHWITDLAGAQAQPLGGAEKLVLNFPHHVLASFLWSMPYLSKLTEMSETELVEDYLQARWKSLLPNDPVPMDKASIAIMRLVVMAQAEDTASVVEAFRALPVVDQSCLVAELSRTGCDNQLFVRHGVSGGPAFLIYYSPALMQRNNKSKDMLEAALHCLCVVLRAARAVWPVSQQAQNSTVVVLIAELKSRDIIDVIRDPGGETRLAWLLVRNNDQEGEVILGKPSEINSLHLEGVQFRVLDFSRQLEAPEYGTKPLTVQRQSTSPPIFGRTSTTDSPSRSFDGPRLLVFTDMSTECDDECALLWLVAALARSQRRALVELVVTDSHARFQWMAHIFGDKFAPGGDWEIGDAGRSFTYGGVKVRMYLAQSLSQETTVINDITNKAPKLTLELEERHGRKEAVWKNCPIGGKDYTEVPGGRLDCVVVAAPIYDVKQKFFSRFTDCKCAYVVGTPGGINCPMPSWAGVLGGLHELCPVLYLTPQFTRSVRFPRQYVKTNPHWNETIRNTVWSAALAFMARRPEFPPKVGQWGLVLRLNIANATFCKDWYFDVKGSKVEDAPRPDYVVEWVQAYVDRNSGDDRAQGTVLDELRNIGVDVSPWGLGLAKSDLDETGKLTSPAAKEAIRARYRQELFNQTMICVLTAETLIFQSKRNFKLETDSAGFEQMCQKSGWTNPVENLNDIYGADHGLQLLKDLPLRWLTPAYDVVAMICAHATLDDGAEIDGGLGLMIAEADDTMGLGLLPEEQRNASQHPVLMTLPQMGEGIYRVGPFV